MYGSLSGKRKKKLLDPESRLLLAAIYEELEIRRKNESIRMTPLYV